MKAHRSEFTVEGMSKALGLTRGGDYRRLKAGPSQRALANERLTQKIHEVFEAGCQTYGSLRVTAAAYHVWTPDIPCLRIWEGAIYVEGFYNRTRLHSTLGGRSPDPFE